MSRPHQPVRPPKPRRPSAAVLRRRRMVFGIGAVLGAALIVIGGVAGVQAIRGAHEASAALTPTPTFTPQAVPTGTPPSPSATPGASSTAASPSATPSSSVSSATVAACIAANITVTPITDATTYGAGQNPKLSMSVTNTGSSACSLDVGTAAQVFTITSGADVWWRSTDCQTDGSHQQAVLGAGKTATTETPVVWDRTRSSSSTCSGSRPAAPAGGASYHVSVSIGGFTSKSYRQIILG